MRTKPATGGSTPTSQVLIRQARKLYAVEGFGMELSETVYALDSTTIDLCLSVFPWAPFRQLLEQRDHGRQVRLDRSPRGRDMVPDTRGRTRPFTTLFIRIAGGELQLYGVIRSAASRCW